jgi:hypothetical protein
MIQQIRTFFGRDRGLKGNRKTYVVMGIAWICLGCGKVFTNKQLSGLHKCNREIPYINYDSV